MDLRKDTLALYGIKVITETKSHVTLMLNGFDAPMLISKNIYNKLIHSVFTYSRIRSECNKIPIKCGIEFEFVGSNIPNDCQRFDNAMTHLLENSYLNAETYHHNKGDLWVLGKDSSIKYDCSILENPTGYELSTPVLNLDSKYDLAYLVKVLSYILLYLHGEVNNSCGTHVHLGIGRSDLSKRDLLNLLSIYGNLEKRIFDPLVPYSRRKNRYCKHTINSLSEKYQKLSSRYCTFDTSNRCNCLHLEFRQLEGTLDLQLILNWIILQACIINDLLKNISNENYLDFYYSMNIMDILFYYDFDNRFISFFLDRIFRFKSKSFQ